MKMQPYDPLDPTKRPQYNVKVLVRTKAGYFHVGHFSYLTHRGFPEFVITLSSDDMAYGYGHESGEAENEYLFMAYLMIAKWSPLPA
jgi:hypothetical protein